MEREDKEQDTAGKRTPQPEGLQPPATLLPDVLIRLGLSSTPVRQPLAALESAEWRERARALQELAASSEPVPLERIAARLRDEHTMVREAAVRALGQLARRVHVPMEYFIYACNDPAGSVRAAAIESLAATGLLSNELLMAALRDGEDQVRLAAIHAAETLGRRAPLDALTGLLQNDPAWPVREAAALALGTLNTPATERALLNALYDPSSHVCHAAAFALRDRIPLPLLLRNLAEGETEVREGTVRILGELAEMGEEILMEALVTAARSDSDPLVRATALLALAQTGRRTPALRAVLLAAQQERDQDISQAATLALESLYPDMLSSTEENMPGNADALPDVQAEERTRVRRREPITEGNLDFVGAGRRELASYIGRQLGNYTFLRLLDDGGLATVYLGEHVYLKEPVAIKVLKRQLPDEECARFQAEAQILARLKHPHIVRVLDFGVERETPYLVMDYAPGGALRQRHPRGERVPPETVIAYVRPIAAALQYAHDQGVIHRDVKPENLLVGEKDEILLSDFGIAVQADPRNENPYQISGTYAYMAPECFEGKPVRASDQYSLAVVVYEWLCGQHPFNGFFGALLRQAVIPAPHEKNPQLPRTLDIPVLKALARSPEQRYGSVQEFAEALEQAFNASQRPKRPPPLLATIAYGLWERLVMLIRRLRNVRRSKGFKRDGKE